ncbi:MAG: hypothetical protein S4CHLAM20_03250 [Chlamydiia bacterium]|nr:hypothetical protein [Chlamydiia bacterium]
MNEPSTLFTLLVLIVSTLITILCYSIAKKKKRNEFLWAFLGFFFGVFSLLVILFLPAKKGSKQRVKETPAPITSMENESAEALPDDGTFEMPRAPRISGSKVLNWYYIDSTNDNNIQGPLPIDEFRKEIHAKHLDDSLYIWCEEFEEWTQICDFSNASLLLDADFIE